MELALSYERADNKDHDVSRVTAIADKLGLDFALIHRKRAVRGAEVPEQMELLVGDVRDKV